MSYWLTDETHDPERTSWVEGALDHMYFPIQNLPYAIFAPKDQQPRAGCAIGDMILDLAACADAGLLPQPASAACMELHLNRLMALPVLARHELRTRLSMLLSDREFSDRLQPHLHHMDDCSLGLPAQIGDYTDFYVGIHHANNVGKLFRPDSPLLPNYKFVPIGYHGRASSVRPSGIPVMRPQGQFKLPHSEAPVFGASTRLDYELEIGVWIGQGNNLGTRIDISDAANHIAGFCLLNDWSARDFQAWEYQPLGPFLAKNFHTTISPWVVTAEAMAPFRIPQAARPPGDPSPLPYLENQLDQSHGGLNVVLEVELTTAAMREKGLAATRLSAGPASNMYWTVGQIVTHHASNGCNLNPGDLLGTGTISAPTRDGFGSLLELSNGGTSPIELPSGETRTFLQDGDEVALCATASAPGFVSIGFGECRAVIVTGF